MKPVLILQNQSSDGPAYLGHWLARQGIAADVRDTQRGDVYPVKLDGHSALALLGGEMSANDELPSLRRAESLILQAFEREVPMLGHCLGGQLMAKALGARIRASPAPEIGWQRMRLLPGQATKDWFGAESGALTVFQWHYEAFELPEGATALASSEACPHQAFAIGAHLAMQFHVELDAEKLARWWGDTSPRYLAARAMHASVQGLDAMQSEAAHRLPAQQALADRIYRRWANTAGLLTAFA